MNNEMASNKSTGDPIIIEDDDKTKSSDQANLITSTSLQTSCDSATFDNLDENRIIKHIMVIGFHHKHGYQVDYCYPPLHDGGPVFSTPSNPVILPTCWKTLPLLCLPDGSHNYDSDTIYFTMPDNQPPKSSQPTEESSLTAQQDCSPNNIGIKTIFGTACYRQIQADKLLNRTDDMTRIAVQKSVCVLSTQPLFGLIRSKLEMITHAYFEELDFSKVKILKLTYDNLNSLLSRDSVKENATFLGLSTRHIVSHFGNNMLVLFKAMLLEKKILFYKSPVLDLCSTIMSMCSLFTGLLESGGLDYSSCDLKLSPALLEALKLSSPPASVEEPMREDKVFFSPAREEVTIISDTGNESFISLGFDTDTGGQKDGMRRDDEEASTNRDQSPQMDTTGEFELVTETGRDVLDFGDEEDSIVDDPFAAKLCQMKPEDFGLPLQIFTHGSFCLPYLSISYLDLLSDKRVRSFVIGATNFLFKQRKEMYDVVVDMEENTIIINDPQLRRCLSLTIEDLRFMDYLSKHVKMEANHEFDPINHDITKWVGGDEWIRYHFKMYTLYLLKASKRPQVAEYFNASFVQTWKYTTNNYKIWDSTGKISALDGLQNRHPFSSQAKGINFADMKLKLSYAVNSSEKGRIVNQTLNGIGKWSIWNNIASAASAAATAAATTINSNLTPSTSASSSDQISSVSRDKTDEQNAANGKVSDV